MTYYLTITRNIRFFTFYWKGDLVTKIDKLSEDSVLHFTYTVSLLHMTYNLLFRPLAVATVEFPRGFFHFDSFSCEIEKVTQLKLKMDLKPVVL